MQIFIVNMLRNFIDNTLIFLTKIKAGARYSLIVDIDAAISVALMHFK